MRKGLLSISLAAIMVAGVLGAIPATAQEAEAPAPEPFACGEVFTDPADDVEEANLDFLKGGIAASDDSSFTVQMQLKNLTTDLPTIDSTGLVWYFLWTYADVTYFANANYSLWTDEVTYNLGTLGGTPPSFSTTASTEGTFTEGEGGTITIVVPLEAVGSPPSGDALTQTYADSRVSLQSPAGGGFVSQIDRAPDGDAYGTDITVASCGSEAASGDDTVTKEKKLTKKMCKRIKNRKKRRRCFKKLKAQNKKPEEPEAPAGDACPPYTPGEQGAEAETVIVTDEHTEEAPLEVTIEHGGPALAAADTRSHVFQNVQVDTAAAESGLYMRYEFPDHEDHDLYLNYSDGSQAAQVAGGNQVAVDPALEEGTGEGGHSEVGAEVLEGLRTADCAGYTADLVNYLGEGGEYTVKLWLGEIQNDPAAPGGGARSALELMQETLR